MKKIKKIYLSLLIFIFIPLLFFLVVNLIPIIDKAFQPSKEDLNNYLEDSPQRITEYLSDMKDYNKQDTAVVKHAIDLAISNDLPNSRKTVEELFYKRKKYGEQIITIYLKNNKSFNNSFILLNSYASNYFCCQDLAIKLINKHHTLTYPALLKYFFENHVDTNETKMFSIDSNDLKKLTKNYEGRYSNSVSKLKRAIEIDDSLSYIHEKIDDLKNKFRYTKFSDSDFSITRKSFYIVGLINTISGYHIYEVQTSYQRKRSILVTKETNFETRGMATLPVTIGDSKIPMRVRNGFKQSWSVYTEVTSEEIQEYREIQEAKKRIKKLEKRKVKLKKELKDHKNQLSAIIDTTKIKNYREL